MDSTLNAATTAAQPKQIPLDPLRRVFVPIEKRMLDRDWRFRTLDGTRYTRNDKSGSITRHDPKPLNKHAKRRMKANG